MIQEKQSANCKCSFYAQITSDYFQDIRGQLPTKHDGSYITVNYRENIWEHRLRKLEQKLTNNQIDINSAQNHRANLEKFIEIQRRKKVKNLLRRLFKSVEKLYYSEGELGMTYFAAATELHEQTGYSHDLAIKLFARACCYVEAVLLYAEAGASDLELRRTRYLLFNFQSPYLP